MFKLSINSDQDIEVIEGGNSHVISLNFSHWSADDLLSHWGFEINGLLNGYSVRYLFLSMIEVGGQGYLRTFRAVRTRNDIHFDDMLAEVPWRVREWNPMECIEYMLSDKGFSRINYRVSVPDRIHEFSVSATDLADYLYQVLEPLIPDDYDSKYKLYYEHSHI